MTANRYGIGLKQASVEPNNYDFIDEWLSFYRNYRIDLCELCEPVGFTEEQKKDITDRLKTYYVDVDLEDCL